MPNSISNLARYLHTLGDLPDTYAALRHALALTDVFATTMPPDGIALPLHAGVLERLTLQEYAWGRLARSGAVSIEKVAVGISHKELAALLRGVIRNEVSVEFDWLLSQLGRSNTLDALVRDALTRQYGSGELETGIAPILRAALDDAERRHRSRVLITLLDIASALQCRVLAPSEVLGLLASWADHGSVLLALLRYIAALHVEGIEEWLRAALGRSSGTEPALRLGLVDALAAVGALDCPLLDAFAESLQQEPGPTRLLRDYIDALRSPKPPAPASSGLVIAQCMFLGRVGQAGKGDSGGLGVFLGALGDAMAENPRIAHVYTLVLLNAPHLDDPPLTLQYGPGHTIVHVPVYGKTLTQYQMMVQAPAIEAAVERVLAALGIEPDVFHLRYADHGSRAAALVARKLGKRIIYTLTADPHRRLWSAFSGSTVAGLDAKALTFELTRVLLADQIITMADGLVSMPTGEGVKPLRSYFPQLILDPVTRSKPLELIAEGIQLSSAVPAEERRDKALLYGLCHFESCQQGYRLDSSFEGRPVMLNVGRLHPIKQQPLLVEAWAGSGLWRTYNLTLIGGNLEDPNAVERAMQTRLEATFAQYPKARGRFCFLPAMPNAEVRRLERTLITDLPAALPHVYVCSSVKEEFGIAVLEAMDAGLLVFGPRVGGLSSYITSGENGFLMDTSTTLGIRHALVEVLEGGAYSADRLRAIAAAGQRTVRERFDIHSTARAFVDFYARCAVR